MAQNEAHVMVKVKQHPNGEEEWYCPECGRRFLMQWPPKYKRTILEPGDESVPHRGGKSEMGLDMNMADPKLAGQAAPARPEPESELDDDEVDDEGLAPWTKWVDDHDIESLFDD